jgi:hypothetical protein
VPQVLIQLGQMVEDDTEAEKCIGEACALFKQASALEPGAIMLTQPSAEMRVYSLSLPPALTRTHARAHTCTHTLSISLPFLTCVVSVSSLFFFRGLV